jgi:hypothetical protein
MKKLLCETTFKIRRTNCMKQHRSTDNSLDVTKPTGTIDRFIGRHAGKVKKPMTIEEMAELAAYGWAKAHRVIAKRPAIGPRR